MSLKNFLLASLTWALLFLGTGDCLAQKDASARSAKYNGEVLRAIASMPKGGAYAVYRKELPENQRYRDLYQVVKDLNQAMDVAPDGSLSVNVTKAGSVSFCSSATYLVFGKAVQNLQKERVIESSRALSREMGLIGGSKEVIKGKLDGVGIFGHWNADGPGTAVLFRKLGLGSNFSGYEKARPGDFLKIFWNEKIGKGERGHSVVYLGTSADGKSIQVWSSQARNEDGSSGYGTMWVEKSRIKRALFSRLEHPENLKKWLRLSPQQKRSVYLIRIRQTGSSPAEMKSVTGAVD